MSLVLALALAVSASPAAGKEGSQALAQPGRDPALLHRNVEQIVAAKEQEQERALRSLLALGGNEEEQAEVTARLAGLLRARGLQRTIRAAAEADQDAAAAERDRAAAQAARNEAISLYRELLRRFPRAPRLDEALFFLADALQDSGKDDEAVKAARELTRRFPKSRWAPASHVFIGEHLFDRAKVAEALAEYRAAAEVETDEVYPYALYKAAWCRFNQNAFGDAMKLLYKVVAVSLGGDAARPTEGADVNKVQLAREARRDYVLVYARVGAPEKARDELREKFGARPGQKMLEQYAKLLFDQGRDPEAQLVHRQLLEIHRDRPQAALDQTRLLMIAARGGKRKELLREAQALVDVFQRVKKAAAADPDGKEALDEAEQHAEETLRSLAVQVHNEARKTHLEDTYAAARALYADYLALFPASPDAYDLRFFAAELLYGLTHKAEAAALYEEVVRQDLTAQQTGKKPGRWLQKAAWGAVLSRAEVAGEKPKEQRGAQRSLTADEELLAAACRLYLQALPDGLHAVEVAFKLGRIEYLSGKLGEAQKHLAWIAQGHPEHELAEYAANLVLDISNLRKDYKSVRDWAMRFLGDKKLVAHGSLLADLRRVEEQSAYALADATPGDPEKAKALLAFVDEHQRGALADKAIFGAAAALSRAGKVDEALAARSRLWKEQPGSPLVPRALLASAADHAAVGDFGEAAALLERYFAGFRRQEEASKWRKAHPLKSAKPEPERPAYEEAKAQTVIHDAAVLREARGELAKALQDRQAALQQWPRAPDPEERLQAIALLHAKLGEAARAARELAAVARMAHGKPALQLSSWREAARLFARVRETGHAAWSWRELEQAYRAVPSKAREKLPAEALAAVAEAHLALGARTFEEFKRQQIQPPLMQTLNRKIALLQQVKKLAEETVAMRQADPAVCALGQLGEAQMLLAQAIAQSPAPAGLSAEQRKLYRDALQEKAKPLLDEARETLRDADGKAHELGVTGACLSRAGALLEKLGGKMRPRAELAIARLPLAERPGLVAWDGRPAEPEAAAALPRQALAGPGERARRLLDDAILAASTARKLDLAQDLVPRFRAAADAAPDSAPALLDYAVALDRAGKPDESEAAYRAAAAAKDFPELRFAAAERAASLALDRGDAAAARAAVELARAALGDDARVFALQARLSLALGDAAAAQAAARAALARSPQDVDALCTLARAHLALGSAGTAKILAGRAAQADPEDAEPLIVRAEIARASGNPAAELEAARAAVEADEGSPRAALILGRSLFERGLASQAADELFRAADLAPDAAVVRLALGIVLAAQDRKPQAEEQLQLAARLAPRWPEPHLELARLALDGKGDAKAALGEAKIFLRLSSRAPPPGHPIHALVQRCEAALKTRTQASVVQ